MHQAMQQLAVPASIRKGVTVDLEQYKKEGKTFMSLKESAEAGALEYVAVQVVQGKVEDITKTEDFGERGTALHYAAKNGHLLVVDFLMEHDARINARSDTMNATEEGNQTPLMWAVKNTHLHPNVILALIERGADVTLTDANEHTALTFSLKRPFLAHTLHVRGCPVQPSDLLYAAKHGYKTGLQYLLENHKLIIPDPNHQSEDSGFTALHEAASHGHYDCVKVLLFAGADAKLKDKSGRTADEMPGCTSSIRKLIAQGVNRYDEDHANLWIISKKDKLKRFLLAAALPNTALVIASLYLPAVFGFVVLLLNLYGVQMATKVSAKSREPEPSLAGWYSGALVFGSTILVMYVFPELDEPVMKAVWWVVTVAMFVCYVRAATCDPGVVVPTKNDREEAFNVIKNGQDPDQLDFCPTTLCKKPFRAKFCSTSLKLVHRFDHYCVWTSNTIGAGNHRPFFFFTVLQSISQSLVLAFAVKFTKLNNQPSYEICTILDYLFNDRNSIVTYFFLFYNIAVILFIGAVFTCQFWYISRNVTSNEVWFPDRYQWCFNIGARTHTLYDRGFWSNWNDFLFGDLKGYRRVLPSMEGNKHLSEKIRKYQEKYGSLGNQSGGHSHGGKPCSGHGGAPPPLPPPPAAVSQKAESPVASGNVKVSGASGNLVDEETGFVYPVQLKDHISKMPLETRKQMAAKQQEMFQQHDLIDNTTGSLSLPDKDQQDRFIASSNEMQSQSQRYIPQTQQVADTRSSATGGSHPEDEQPAILTTSVTRSASLRTTAKMRSSTQTKGE
eukprot:TRINITY_DN30299_c0_g1_i1.p1 TRINITY_DN30299_c0_g1~~TRINITY_DN30299_c0_g1_i1.p1  ORF type:complete len:785 (+),score=213.54 TRINITY_DN30299_c0_g1_i1:72-2426(+)